MYKLVGVGGKVRGQEFVLEEGENRFGTGSDVDHTISVKGISRRHMSISVHGEQIMLEDLGSANGTIVNDKLVKKTALKNGDKVALPNSIFQIVYVKEKKKIVHRKVTKQEEDSGPALIVGEDRQDFFGKLIVFFQKKIMPTFHSFNEKYEWSHLVGFCFALMIGLIVAVTISPVLRSSKALLKQELVQRAVQYANEVKRLNYAALARRDFDKLNTGFLEREKEIAAYELFDQEGRIIAPLSKNNLMIQDEFSIETRNKVVRRTVDGNENAELRNKGYFEKDLPNGQIGIGVPIYARDLQTGQNVVKGAIALKFQPTSLLVQAKRESGAYLEAFAISLGIGVLFFAIVYFLTTFQILYINKQAEIVANGKAAEIESPYLFSELAPLVQTMNNAFSRIQQLDGDEFSDFAPAEDSALYVERLREFLECAQGPALVADSDKNIQFINGEGEDLTGVRESASQGMPVVESMRDQGLAATIVDLCDKSAADNGNNQKDYTPIGGRDYVVNVASLLGKDGSAKAHLVTFKLDN